MILITVYFMREKQRKVT